MTRYSILLGSALEDFRQKKIEEMYNFLDSKKNADDSIVTFANGISEMMLEMVMDNSLKQLAENSGQLTDYSEQQTEVVVEPVETTEQNARHCESIGEAISENNEQRTVNRLQSTDDNKQTVSIPSITTDKNLRLYDTLCRAQQGNYQNLCSCTGVSASSAGNSFAVDKTTSILLYVCTLQPVVDGEKTFWLGGEEIRREVIEHYQTLVAECGIDMQVIFDSDSEMVREEELGWEEVVEQIRVNRLQNADSCEHVVSTISTTSYKGRHCETKSLRHCERSEAISETAGEHIV